MTLRCLSMRAMNHRHYHYSVVVFVYVMILSASESGCDRCDGAINWTLFN